MEKIIQILMERDGYSREESIDRCNEIKEMMEECEYDPEECEDIFMGELELEPDYLVEFLFGM